MRGLLAQRVRHDFKGGAQNAQRLGIIFGSLALVFIVMMVVIGLTVGPCDQTEQPQQTAEVVRISAGKLLLEYQGNEIAAGQKYRWLILQLG